MRKKKKKKEKGKKETHLVPIRELAIDLRMLPALDNHGALLAKVDVDQVVVLRLDGYTNLVWE